jgi:hypothetical protein
MSATAQFIVGVEGFDIYPAGALGNAYPWYTPNSTYQGNITSGSGAFGGNALSFNAGPANASGLEYQFPSTMQVMRALSSAGGSGAFGLAGWINVGTPSANGTEVLLALSSSATPAAALPLLLLTNSVSAGLNLALPASATGTATANGLLSVQSGSFVWVGVYFSYSPTGKLLVTLCLNGTPIFTDQAITFSADVFTGGKVCDRLKFYQSTLASWSLDDLVIHAVSSADAAWDAPASINPEILPHMSPRQVTLAQATGNGSYAQMTPSGSEPNYQSATDSTGANSVTATAINQVDTYKWQTTATDIKAVVYRGQSAKYGQLNAVQNVGGALTAMPVQSAGPNEFIGISENDGSNAWSASSITAAEFGQTAHA